MTIEQTDAKPSVSALAAPLVDGLIARRVELGISVSYLDQKATVIDAGIVSFTKNSYVYDINNSSTTFNNFNSVNPRGVNGMDSLIRNTFITGASSMDNSFALVLPMAVSSQFDVCLHRSRKEIEIRAKH